MVEPIRTIQYLKSFADSAQDIAEACGSGKLLEIQNAFANVGLELSVIDRDENTVATPTIQKKRSTGVKMEPGLDQREPGLDPGLPSSLRPKRKPPVLRRARISSATRTKVSSLRAS